jgi:1-acyl-sn-glycerol-3-phosphate acyltransferase
VENEDRRHYGRLGRYARAVLAFLVIIPLSLVFLFIAPFLLPWRGARLELSRLWARVVAGSVLLLLGVTFDRAAVKEIARRGPAVFVVNHTSSLDLFLVAALLNRGACGVSKVELGRVPFLGWVYRLSGHLLIDRSDTLGAIEALNRVTAEVRKKRLSPWIAPEGTRSASGRLLPFKKGFVHLAMLTGLPVVPIVIRGAHRLWPAKTLRFGPGRVDIEVLAPVPTAAWTTAATSAQASALHDLFAAHLPGDQRPAHA